MLPLIVLLLKTPAIGGHFPPPASTESSHFQVIYVGNGPNTVSERRVSNTELSRIFGSHRVPGRELSECLSAYYNLCAEANLPSFSQDLPSLVQNSVSSLFQNSALKTVLHPFPNMG